VNCRSGDTIAEEQSTANSHEQVLSALSQAATRLRVKLGESRDTVAEFDTPLEQATTPSLEALRAYSMRWRDFVNHGDATASVPAFQKAVEIDPQFAIAYAALANSYAEIGEISEAPKNARKAYELQVAWSTGKLGVEDAFLNPESGSAAYFGQFRKARDYFRKAVVAAEHAGEKEIAATYEAEQAVREAIVGKSLEARTRAASAL
jgi:tetratricopeptide (TPR) repeat protein